MTKDIGIYTTRAIHAHKMSAIRGGAGVYWSIPNAGNNSVEEWDEQPERLWFAFDGVWQGHFLITLVNGNDVDIDKWVPIAEPEHYPRKPFRGYTKKTPTVLDVDREGE